MTRFVSIGDLVTDIYYDKNLRLIGADGGITCHNIICNLKYMGFDAFAFGVCGNDFVGRISINSLNDCGVKNDIFINDKIRTKAYHIRRIIKDGKYAYKSIKYSPYTKVSSWYEGSYILERDILKKIQKDDILVFDNLNAKNQFIVDNTSNLKLLDLGLYDEFDSLSKEEIIKKIKGKFEIINLNERVEKYLLDKLDCKDDVELSKLILAKLIIITRGINGNDFIFNNQKYSYPLKEIVDEVDDSGAGDAFFSTIIKNWINNDMKIEESKLDLWADDTASLIKKVLRLVGSRRHIKKLYKVRKKDF